MAANLERSSSWSGVRAGDPVEVIGTRLRAASWTFLAHVRNGSTGEEWVEVVGGRSGDRKVRSFRTEQVYPRRGRSAAARRAGSLAEAPQLPFG